MTSNSSTDIGLVSALTPLWREPLVVIWETLELIFAPLEDLLAEKGHGEPIILIPGFGATDLSMIVLYWRLFFRGYTPYTSRLGINWHCLDESVQTVAETQHKIYLETGRKVHLIGHSLGGMIAAVVGLINPQETGMIINMGTPQKGDAGVHPVLIGLARANRFRLYSPEKPSCFTTGCTCVFGNTVRKGIDPDICIYSSVDGVVESSSTRHSDESRNRHAYGASHSGMSLNSRVLRIVTKELANARSAS